MYLCVVAGWARRGLLDGVDGFHEQDLAKQKAACLSQAPAGSGWEEASGVLPAGGMTLHDNYTLHGSGPNFSQVYRRSLAIHMRTNHSRPKSGEESSGVLEFLGQLDVNPVVFGKAAFAAEQASKAAAKL